jgi:hypothetical protein
VLLCAYSVPTLKTSMLKSTYLRGQNLNAFKLLELTYAERSPN